MVRNLTALSMAVPNEEPFMRQSRIFSTTVALGLAAWSYAAPPRNALIVSPAWLAQHLKDPDLVLLHVGDKAEYDAAHIPGARFVNVRDISADRGNDTEALSLEMPSKEVLRDRLAALGVSDDSRVVVYFGKDWVSPSTRVIFTLDYAGLGDRASLLDGGQPAWVREGHAVTTQVPEAVTGKLKALSPKPIVVTQDFVREHATAKGYVLLDARAAAFYDGVQPGGRPPKLGHLPGARSLPFTEMTNERLQLRSAEELQTRFAQAGVKPGDTVIAYCHIGQQATALLFAARTLGFNVLLYDGSFEDWSRRPENLLVNPAAPAAPVRLP
jgi:thiosulfate/3-mercaptopyruvate sulfurtransferase